jgi:hypothetical protein
LQIPALSPRLIRLALIGLAFAVALALGSVGVQRSGPEQAVVANVCGASFNEACHEAVRNGGFPLAFVFNVPSISVPYKLGPEDDFRFVPFVGDVAAFWGLLALAWSFGLVRRRNMAEIVPRRRKAP